MKLATVLVLVLGVGMVAALAAAGEQAPPKADIAGQLGKATARAATKIKHQKAMREGGAREELSAPEGQVFLVLRFAETAAKSEKILYREQEVGLELKEGEQPLRAHAVTTNNANPKNDGQIKEPHFSTDGWMTEFTPRADLPFELVFAVPADAKSATLVLGDSRQKIEW